MSLRAVFPTIVAVAAVIALAACSGNSAGGMIPGADPGVGAAPQAAAAPDETDSPDADSSDAPALPRPAQPETATPLVSASSAPPASPPREMPHATATISATVNAVAAPPVVLVAFAAAPLAKDARSASIVLKAGKIKSPATVNFTGKGAAKCVPAKGCTIPGPAVKPGSYALSVTLYDKPNAKGNALATATVKSVAVKSAKTTLKVALAKPNH